MATAQEQLAELDNNPALQNVAVNQPAAGKTAREQLAELDKMDFSSMPTPVPGLTDKKQTHGVRSAKEARQVLNEGFYDVLGIPLDIIDFQRTLLGDETADRLGAPPSKGDVVRGWLADTGQIPKKGDKPVGVIADTLNLFGASLPFSIGMLKWGAAGVNKAAMGAIETTGTGLLRRPTEPLGAVRRSMGEAASTKAGMAHSISLDLSSSWGVSLATELSDEFDLGPAATVTAQLIGGFIHPGAVLNRMSSGRTAFRVRDSMIPGGSAKNQRRAARELQGTTKNPEAAAAEIDISSPIPAARQVGSEGSLQLEQRVLNTDPRFRQQYTDDLNEAIDRAIADGRTFGDQKLAGRELEAQSKRATTFSKQQSDRHIRLMELRSAQAGQEAEIAVSQLGPDATVDDVSRIVREKTEDALKAARVVETDAWGLVDQRALVEPTETVAAVNSELKAMSKRFGDKSLVPVKVKKLLAVYRSKKEAPLTLGDMQAVRSHVNEMYDAARTAGRKNEARILNNIAKSLSKDIESSGAAGMENALRVSRELNKNFTQGAVGDLLAVRSGGVPRIQPRESLQTLTGRRGAAEALQQMIKGNPGVEGDIRQFVKSSYYTSVLVEAGGNPTRIQTLHKQFIRRMKKQGVMDVFPDVESQLTTTRNSVLKDANVKEQLKVANKQGGIRYTANRKKTLANEYMGGNGDILLDRLLVSKNPLVEAKGLVRTMEGNPGAKQGLKAAFIDSLYRKATDSAGEINHKKLATLISNHAETGRALGMDASEVARMKHIQEVISASRMKPTGPITGGVVQDSTGFILRALSRYGAVQFAGVVPTKGAGASLQMANLFASQGQKVVDDIVLSDIKKSGGFLSSKLRSVLGSIGRDGASELIKAAHTDNTLYQALMVAPTSSKATQEVAARHIQAWLPALSIQDENRFREKQ